MNSGFIFSFRLHLYLNRSRPSFRINQSKQERLNIPVLSSSYAFLVFCEHLLHSSPVFCHLNNCLDFIPFFHFLRTKKEEKEEKKKVIVSMYNKPVACSKSNRVDVPVDLVFKSLIAKRRFRFAGLLAVL